MSLTIKNAAMFSGGANLFGTQSTNNNNSIFGASGMNDMSGLISEYNSIKNGSYAKLAKQYYGKDVKGTSNSSNPVADKLNSVDGTVKNKTEITQNKELISDVSTLRKQISGITNDDTLFQKVEKKDENGATVYDYNYDKINQKLDAFVKGYNEVIKAGGDSNNSTVLRNTLNMTNATDNYKQQLAQAGITVNSDNTLSYDKDAMKASLNDTAKSSAVNSKSVFTGEEAVKNLFGKNSNYMKQLDTMATNVASQAASDVYSLGGYTSTGAYKQTLENIYNTVI